MATGRTVQKYSRLYVGSNGAGEYPSLMCGLTRSFGPLTFEYSEVEGTTMCDDVKSYLPGECTVSLGKINAILTPYASAISNMYPSLTGVWDLLDDVVMQIVLGIRAAPILGDPMFGGVFPWIGMQYTDDGGLVTATLDFGAGWSAGEKGKNAHPWGQLLHPYGEETGANSSTGADWGNSTADGGLMLLHIFGGAASSTTFKVQHADTNSDGSFGDLTGASVTTTGVGAHYAIVEPGTAVKRYLRWQMTAVTSTFVMSFIRG